MSQFEEKLKAAITGEYNAIRKYKKFAEVAAKENLPNIAYLFKALIAGETVHLNNHKRALSQEFMPKDEDFTVGTTLENLKTSIEGESWEHTEMYPDFIKSIKKEKFGTDEWKVAELSMRWAKEVEVTHEETLLRALSYLEQGKDFENTKLWVCIACGNLFVGNKPNIICPVCKHDAEFYKMIPR